MVQESDMFPLFTGSTMIRKYFDIKKNIGCNKRNNDKA